MAAEYMLTTIDNPYSPFDEFALWYTFDIGHGYHCCEYLARLAPTSLDMSDADYNLIIDNAINTIITDNINGLYEKVQASDYPRKADYIILSDVENDSPLEKNK